MPKTALNEVEKVSGFMPTQVSPDFREKPKQEIMPPHDYSFSLQQTPKDILRPSPAFTQPMMSFEDQTPDRLYPSFTAGASQPGYTPSKTTAPSMPPQFMMMPSLNV